MATKVVTKASAGLADFIVKLEVDAVGTASLDSWKGTRLEESALKLLPAARSVVVMAMEVYPEVLEHATRGKKIADTPVKGIMESHSDFLNDQLTRATYSVAKASRQSGLKALPLAKGLPFDRRRLSAVFSYKHAAQAAGLGSLGRSSLLITPEFGPRVRLACCLTEAVLKPTSLKTAHECGTCHVCIDKCPSGALAHSQGDEPYHINKFACNSYRADGYCFECMRLCPAGR